MSNEIIYSLWYYECINIFIARKEILSIISTCAPHSKVEWVTLRGLNAAVMTKQTKQTPLSACQN